MTANEWLEIIKQTKDFPAGMEKLIIKYGELIANEHLHNTEMTLYDKAIELVNSFNKPTTDMHGKSFLSDRKNVH